MAGNCIVCECNAGLGNTGTDCSPLQKAAYTLIGVPIYQSDGSTRNSIDLENDVLNAAYFTALINQADITKRWFPYPAIKNVEDTRGENQTEEFTDKTQVFVTEGARAFKGWIVGRDAQPVLKGKIETSRCVQMGYYVIDLSGNLIGSISSDGTKLYPIQVDENSVAAMFIKPTDSTIQKLQLQFNWHPIEKDENLRMITCSELTGVNLLSLRGLLDVCSEVSNITQSGFRIAMNTSYGTILNPVRVEGLVIADFVSSDTAVTSKLYNQTDDADVTITSVTEVSGQDGVYDVVFPTQAAADVLIVKVIKTGFDFQCTEDAPVVLPAT